MQLINRSKKDPLGGPACAEALRVHSERFGHYARRYTVTMYTVKVKGKKVTVEVLARRYSYVARAIIGHRQCSRLPGVRGGHG